MEAKTTQSKRNEITYEQFLKEQREGYCDKLCDLKGLNVKDSRERLIQHVEAVLDEINKTRGPVENFTIGKTHAGRKSGKAFDYQTFLSWKKKGGIAGRWEDYKKEGYDCLIVLYGFTTDSVPETGRKCSWLDQHVWALAYEQHLIQYFLLEKEDSRLGNKSLESGGRPDRRARCGVVYVAIKLDKRTYNMSEQDHPLKKGNRIDFDTILKTDEKGYSANLCADLNEKPLEDAAQCLISHCIDTLCKLEKERGSIRRYTIGRSYATCRKARGKYIHLKTKDFSTWIVGDSIAPLWNKSLRPIGYDCLIVLCGLTKDNVPKQHESSAENQLIKTAKGDRVEDKKKTNFHHHFTGELYNKLVETLKYDERYKPLPENSTGKIDEKTICSAIYVAVEFHKREIEQLSMSDDRPQSALVEETGMVTQKQATIPEGPNVIVISDDDDDMEEAEKPQRHSKNIATGTVTKRPFAQADLSAVITQLKEVKLPKREKTLSQKLPDAMDEDECTVISEEVPPERDM